MIGLMDLTESEQRMLVDIAEGVLLDGLYVSLPYWQPSGRNMTDDEFDDYCSLYNQGLVESIASWCQQVMPTRDAVQLIRWLQGLD